MKKDIIRIGDIELDMADYVISGNAILGIRDSGKTVTAKGLAEQMQDAGYPFIVFDAVGKWRWMKNAGPGARGKGYKVVVIGGAAPDLPMNVQSIEDIVRASIKENISLVIDLFDANLSKADWRRIVQKSIHVIHYENKGLRHVFLEEAAEFVPQKPMDFETYAELEKLVRMGGNASVGITLISPRAQELNKAVLEMCSNLILGCQIGNRAIEAVEKWLERLSPDIGDKVTRGLPKLESGQSWVWTRRNPDDPKLEQMPMCRSFHPDRREVEDPSMKPVKTVDAGMFVKTLTDLLPKIVEEKKANDPVELKKTIKDLQGQVAKLEKGKPVVHSTTVKTERFLTKPESERLTRMVAAGEKMVHLAMEDLRAQANRILAFESDLNFIKTKLSTLQKTGDGKAVIPTANATSLIRVPPVQPTKLPASPTSKAHQHSTDAIGYTHAGNGEVKFEAKDKKFLAVLSNYPEGCNAGKLMLLSGYKWNSDSRNALSRLRTAGAIVGGNQATMQITEHGRTFGPFETLPTGRDLLNYWTSHGSFEAKDKAFLKAFIANPNGLTATQLCEITNYEWNSDTRNALSRLRTAQVIEGRNGETMKLAPHLQEHL